jgi:integrase
MPAGRLTKRIIDGLPVEPRDYYFWDTDLKGFGFRVRKTGARSFIAQYRIGGRNTVVQRVTIGTYGKMTVEEAREAARKVLAKAELGEDVAEQKAKERAEKTLADLCDLYLLEGCELKKASTLKSDKGRIARHIKPLLGTKRIGKITSADIEKFMRDVANGKTAVDVKTGKHGRAIVKGGKGTATRTVRLLGGIFTFAIKQRMLKTNPAHGVAKYADKKGERYLSTDELMRLGASIRLAETDGLPWDIDATKPKAKHVAKTNQQTKMSPHVAGALRLLLFTGCRLREVLHLRWEHVDFERGLLLLPDSKTGRKTVVLNAPALAILNELPRVGDYVIAGESDEKPRSDLKRPWSQITKHAGLEGLRIHDLRHSFASFGAGGGMGLPIVGKLLGHANSATTARYAHLDADPLRMASNRIGSTIAAALSAQPETPSKIVPIGTGMKR